ncbi:trimeric intracellular cation channel family protein [Actinocorallia longicatena]|uniref:Trimeric intracellular cation channel family protein n=1 Tax=Actinocorallia longicatena TaxID=111803 RepID=A0ABP6Q668_9ACTN
MIELDWLLPLFDYAGIAVFAITGALAALRKRLDIVGVVVLAAMTALGGGIVRDTMIGTLPPAAATNIGYVIIPVVAAVIVYFWHPQVSRMLGVITVLDAAGLGLFCTTGAQKALLHGISPLHATVLGVVTAIGGGIIRDMLSNQVPEVLSDRQLYAVPAILGAAIVAIAWALDVRNGWIIFGATLLAFTLRMIALRRSWQIPATPEFTT